MAKFKQLFEKIDPNGDSRFDELDTSGYSPSQQMQGEGFGNLIKGLVGDTAPSEGDEGVRESMSPIDLISPGMVTAPAKVLGRGVLSVGKDVVEAAPRLLGNEIGIHILMKPGIGLHLAVGMTLVEELPGIISIAAILISKMPW
jgi:hypothetical protein